MARYLAIRNWDKFQQYKDGRPMHWVKAYTALLSDYEWGSLDDAHKGHLTGLWLLAATSKNRIPWDNEWVARRVQARSPVDLDALVAAGFLVPVERLDDAEDTPKTQPVRFRTESYEASTEAVRSRIVPRAHVGPRGIDRPDDTHTNTHTNTKGDESPPTPHPIDSDASDTTPAALPPPKRTGPLLSTVLDKAQPDMREILQRLADALQARVNDPLTAWDWTSDKFITRDHTPSFNIPQQVELVRKKCSTKVAALIDCVTKIERDPAFALSGDKPGKHIAAMVAKWSTGPQRPRPQHQQSRTPDTTNINAHISPEWCGVDEEYAGREWIDLLVRGIDQAPGAPPVDPMLRRFLGTTVKALSNEFPAVFLEAVTKHMADGVPPAEKSFNDLRKRCEALIPLELTSPTDRQATRH